MKVLFVLGRYLPEKTAGIENYTHLIAQLLLRNNQHVDVAILNSQESKPYKFDEILVIPLKTGPDGFKDLLQEQQYDICHFQEYSGTNGINIDWFTIAKEYCKKVFFTFHLPYLTCYKNDFRYNGIMDCNNFSNPERCVNCIIETRLNDQKKRLKLQSILVDVMKQVIKLTPGAGSLKKNIILRQNVLNELIDICDHLFIYAPWFKEILKKNGYSNLSIKSIPYLAKTAFLKRFVKESRIKRKILFVGRIEFQKGLHLLCQAMNLISTEDVQVDVFGNVIDSQYFADCSRQFPFIFKKTLPLPELLEILPEYDFLILPSLFTEMYSMIARNAFYEHVPVIASAAKGNVDMIEEGKNGFIFDYGNAYDLARKIDQSYVLLMEGWRPTFLSTSDAERDEQELLSYYQ